jgi:hypothetical protein
MKKSVQKECPYSLLATGLAAILFIVSVQLLALYKALDIPDTSPGFSYSLDYQFALASVGVRIDWENTKRFGRQDYRIAEYRAAGMVGQNDKRHQILF